MELGPHQLQIFLSLLVIVGAACAALVCDLLRANHEQLRELTRELKIRREEEEKRYRPQPAAEPKTPTAITERASAANAESRRAPSPAALAAMERGEQLAAKPKPPAREQEAPLKKAAPAG
jgi:hypothetical protein